MKSFKSIIITFSVSITFFLYGQSEDSVLLREIETKSHHAVFSMLQENLTDEKREVLIDLLTKYVEEEAYVKDSEVRESDEETDTTKIVMLSLLAGASVCICGTLLYKWWTTKSLTANANQGLANNNNGVQQQPIQPVANIANPLPLPIQQPINNNVNQQPANHLFDHVQAIENELLPHGYHRYVIINPVDGLPWIEQSQQQAQNAFIQDLGNDYPFIFENAAQALANLHQAFPDRFFNVEWGLPGVRREELVDGQQWMATGGQDPFSRLYNALNG